ncbi:MAG: carboxylating nicotinate-nucleotide diphosphorylase [Deltaproteobacteria bacterium]|jgi:nicotinate-nucleotide pyrophosphorylase (carboxylating)|nr:carboxylating nicotinate-nucleotide diphosphorylase [Deltaproteobacteria bacterium]MBW2383323.1 carboxylating nicotinate-nucleotide diphosphorylase [Deltaproteobacteria bacterium]
MTSTLTPPLLRAWSGLVDLALTEDIGTGDVTSDLSIPADAAGAAHIEARQPLVVCGLFVAREVIRRVSPEIVTTVLVDEGQSAETGQRLMELEGKVRAILAAERTALNFLGRLCGIATLTARYVREVEGTSCQIVDTRKTLPGWRALDKFAVRAGGGVNHRFALYDGILLKDNHIAVAGGVEPAVKSAIQNAPAGLRVQVEVESAEQALAACDAGADFLLLDNCSPDEVQEIVTRLEGRALLEASGGITLENVRQFAEAGVRRVSLGALTHSAPSADVALEIARPRGAP